MKKVFHKILSLSMTFVVLFSTLSFTIDMHYCGDTLMDSAIFKKAATCGMEMEKPLDESCSSIKKSCCSEEQVVVNGQDQLQLQVDHITFQQQAFLVSFAYTYSTLYTGIKENVISYEVYQPPLVTRQLYKLDETYLI